MDFLGSIGSFYSSSIVQLPAMEKQASSGGRYRRPTTVDGGYGWVIVAASFMGHVFQYGVVWSVGVFYVLFLENIEGEQGAVALISSLNTATFYVTGPLSAMLTNKYGCRPVAMIGGFIGSLGLVLSVFANNIYYLYGTFGILTGFGLGLSFIPTISIVGFYFEKRRSLAVGVAVSGVGIGTFAFPPIIRLLVHLFGYRGAILVTGGLCLNLVVCGALFRPFIPEQTVVEDTQLSPEALRKKQEAEGQQNVPKKQKIFHFNIFKNVTYVLLSVNNVLVTFGMSVIYIHFSAYATSIGYSDDAGAMLISIIGVSNFVGRILYGLLALFPRLQPIHLYTISFIIAGIATIICPLVQAYAALMSFAVVFGVTTAALGSVLPILIVNCLNVEMLPSGYGYMLVFEAIGTLIGGPVAGALYQWSEYYPLSLWVGGAAMILSGVSMIYPCLKPRIIRGITASRKEQELVVEEDENDDLIMDVAQTA